MYVMFYTYVLLSLKDKNFYIGFTRNVEKRFEEHQSGAIQSTKGRRPYILVFYEMHQSKLDAFRRERYFKTTKGKKTLRQMLRNSS